MSGHLLIKGFSCSKTKEGEWQISQMSTNQGIFRIGEQENLLLDQDVLDRFCSYVANELRVPLEAFLQEEAEQE